jgi:hypothetical protein
VLSFVTGVVPVTLVSSKRDSPLALVERQTATHAEYSGSVLFRNQFVGELPAAEYPKIGVRDIKLHFVLRTGDADSSATVLRTT